ncbi:MAG: membrane protein insertase YidC [bacterium]
MDREDRIRLIVAIVVAGIILLGYNIFYAIYSSRRGSREGAVTLERSEEERGVREDVLREAIPDEEVAPKTSAPSEEESLSVEGTSAGESTIRVRTSLFDMVLTSRGAGIKRLELLKYGDKDRPVVLVDSKSTVVPLLAVTEDRKIESYRISNDSDLMLERPGQVGSVEFVSEDGSKRKTYTFRADSYKMDIEFEVVDPDNKEVEWVWSDWIGSREQSLKGDEFYIEAVNYTIEKEKREWHRDKLSGSSSPFAGCAAFFGGGRSRAGGTEVVYRGRVEWSALSDHYFVAALVPRNFGVSSLVKREEKEGGRNLRIHIKTPPLSGVGEVKSYAMSVYVGPKEYFRIKGLNLKGLERVIDFGFWGFISIAILWALNFFYGFVKNYGVAIILLTVVIKIVLLPLTQSSFKSMQKMKDIQPQVNAIREKYKNDPQRANREMQILYRKYGVNPLGGCLPMLLQFPILIAFFTALRNAAELRGAEFALWIKDLSAPDTVLRLPMVPIIGNFLGDGENILVNILPIVMGATMYIQQKMTPSTGGAASGQMAWLPFIFLFFFWNMPSGLVLYWTVSNILAIGHQYIVNRWVFVPSDGEKAEDERKLASKRRKR